MASDLASEFSRARLYRSGGCIELAGLAESGPVRLQAQLGSQHWSWKGEARRGRLPDAWCVQGARVRKDARFPSGAEFSPSAAPRTCRAAAVNARGAARWPGRALAQRGQHASRRGANLQCTAAHGTERGDRESAPRPVRAAGK